MRKVTALMLALVFSAAGCINVDQEIMLNNDGSGTMTVRASAEQSFYESEEFGTTAADMAEAFRELGLLDGFELLGEKEYEAGGMHTWERNYRFKDIVNMSEEEFSISFKTEGGDRVLDVNAVFVSENDPGLTEDELATEEVQALLTVLENYRFKFQVTVPEPVKDAPGARVSGRTVAWEIPLSRFVNPEEKSMRMRVAY